MTRSCFVEAELAFPLQDVDRVLRAVCRKAGWHRSSGCG
jgi:hypothetical protein